jgi:DNA-binding response OmpR family regulator
MKKITIMSLKDHISHILVIDDDEFLLSVIRKKLELAGHKVTISSNIHDAYFKLTFSKPDLILLDVIMPEMNGLEFMNLLHSQIGTLGIPVILMSYLQEKDIHKMGYDLGKTQYLAKPFKINYLSARLEKLYQKGLTSTSSF